MTLKLINIFRKGIINAAEKRNYDQNWKFKKAI